MSDKNACITKSVTFPVTLPSTPTGGLCIFVCEEQIVEVYFCQNVWFMLGIYKVSLQPFTTTTLHVNRFPSV